MHTYQAGQKAVLPVILFFLLASVTIGNAAGDAEQPCYRITAGCGHVQALRPGGTLWGWGMPLDGNLADGSAGGHKFVVKEPKQAKGPGGKGELTDIVEISCLQVTTLGLHKNGTIRAWGTGTSGQLGNGAAQSSAVPVQVKSTDGNGVFENAVAVSAGHMHACALKSDGTVWVWGLNDRGQLGNGSTVKKSVLPVQVKSPDGKGVLDNVISIAAGVGHCLAVQKDGTVLGWGENVVGQIGDGTTTDRYLPVKVSGIENAVKVFTGWHFSYALCKDGSLWAWGYNVFGQLGDGTVYDRHQPVRVKSPDGKGFFADAAEVSGGALHVFVITTDGTLWACGGNHFGQLGIGKPGGRKLLFTQVKGPGNKGFLESVLDADAGSAHSAAVTADGTVYCWGDNYRKQIGDPAVPVKGWIMDGIYVDNAVVKAKGLYRKGAMGVNGPPFPWPARLPSERAVAIMKTLAAFGPESKDRVSVVNGHLDDKDVLIRIAVVRTLGRIGAGVPGVVKGLTKALDDKDRSVPLESVKMLSACDPGAEGVISALKTALVHKDSAVAYSACKALGNFREAARDAIPDLQAAAKKGGRLGQQAIDMLSLIGEAALPVLIEGVEAKGDWGLRMKYIQAIGNLGPKAAKAVPALIKAMEDKNHRIRQHTAWTLSKIGPAAKAAIPILKKALNDENNSVRYNAKVALEKIGGDIK